MKTKAIRGTGLQPHNGPAKPQAWTGKPRKDPATNGPTTRIFNAAHFLDDPTQSTWFASLATSALNSSEVDLTFFTEVMGEIEKIAVGYGKYIRSTAVINHILTAFTKIQRELTKTTEYFPMLSSKENFKDKEAKRNYLFIVEWAAKNESPSTPPPNNFNPALIARLRELFQALAKPTSRISFEITESKIAITLAFSLDVQRIE